MVINFLYKLYNQQNSSLILESVKQAERVKLDDIPLPDAASNQAGNLILLKFSSVYESAYFCFQALALFHDSDMPMQPGVSQKGILKKYFQMNLILVKKLKINS